MTPDKFDKLFDAMIESETKSDLQYLYQLFTRVNKSTWIKI